MLGRLIFAIGIYNRYSTMGESAKEAQVSKIRSSGNLKHLREISRRGNLGSSF